MIVAIRGGVARSRGGTNVELDLVQIDVAARDDVATMQSPATSGQHSLPFLLRS
jgi:hypothetical protein